MDDAPLDLGVAIRAEEDALVRFGPGALDGAADSPSSDVELLVGGVEMMKLHCPQVTVIATQPTRSSRLTHEYLLDRPAARDHCFCAAFHAAVVPGAAGPREGRESVVSALSRDRCGAFVRNRSRSRRIRSRQFVAPQPVAHSADADLEALGHLLEGEPFRHQGFESLA